MKKIKDKFIIQLIFFIVFILILFLYLFKIENSIKNYDEYKNNINSLIILNLKFNNFLEKKEEFISFDKIVKQTNEFRIILNNLLSSNLKEEFSPKIYRQIQNIDLLFEKKLVLLERFKSRKASNLNSIHYVYDLNQFFTKNEILKKETKVIINNTLFMVMQHFSNLDEKE